MPTTTFATVQDTRRSPFVTKFHEPKLRDDLNMNYQRAAAFNRRQVGLFNCNLEDYHGHT